MAVRIEKRDGYFQSSVRHGRSSDVVAVLTVHGRASSVVHCFRLASVLTFGNDCLSVRETWGALSRCFASQHLMCVLHLCQVFLEGFLATSFVHDNPLSGRRFRLAQRARAALRAIARRRWGLSLLIRIFAPFRPSATAWGFFFGVMFALYYPCY